MGRHRRPEEIRRLLREADRDLAKGLTVGDICQKLGIRSAIYYRWRQRYDPARIDNSPRVRELEGEVERLKRLIADIMLDKQMLEEVAKKKW